MLRCALDSFSRFDLDSVYFARHASPRAARARGLALRRGDGAHGRPPSPCREVVEFFFFFSAVWLLPCCQRCFSVRFGLCSFHTPRPATGTPGAGDRRSERSERACERPFARPGHSHLGPCNSSDGDTCCPTLLWKKKLFPSSNFSPGSQFGRA